jgi:3-dehydroquinate synthase
MMTVRRIQVGSSTGSYAVLVEEGSLRDFAGRIRGAVRASNFCVVSDTRVGGLYGAGLAEQLGAPLFELPEGEQTKNLATLDELVNWLVRQGVERDSGVVAVGGGVVTDVAGFAAAITLRGLHWVAVPTTLLGMVDAAIGGKTGVDLAAGKNLIGCFWPPEVVLVDPGVLATLARRQLRSGLMEVLKAAIISPFLLEDALDRGLVALAGGQLGGAAELIGQAVRVKAEVVSADEHEEGSRAALNLGHTLGHALEAATAYRLFLHGEAVGWGLLAALRLARDRGLLATDEAMRWAARMQVLAPFPPVSQVSWDDVLAFLSRDKKRSGGVLRWVLPRPGGVTLGVELSEGEVAGVYRELQALPASDQFTLLF